ncbi:type II restriction enzyme [Enterococcus sp. LJL98]
MTKENKVDIAWKSLFEKYDIVSKIESNGVFEISANQIKEFREPRLMTKFDHKANLPLLFRNNKLSILPNTRGTYIIGKFNAYHKLKTEEIKPKTVVLPDFVRSFDNFPITSESTMLNVAHFSGMIDQLMETSVEGPSSVLTLSGRMGSGVINYRIKERKNKFYDFRVEGSQIEIDGSYENAEKIVIIEAKNKLPLDFHIRQLYYPYRVYNELVTTKEILPVFLTYADDIFSFHIFKFNCLDEYNSIEKIKQVNFIINKSLNLNIKEVKSISYNSAMLENTKNIPFPQANSMTRILDVLEFIQESTNLEQLAQRYEFDQRQSRYYIDVLRFLGYAIKNDTKEYELTPAGKRIQKMNNNNNRNKNIIQDILQFKVFKLSFDSVIKNNQKFDKDYIFKVIKESQKNIGTETIRRRVSTVESWIKWIFSVVDE